MDSSNAKRAMIASGHPATTQAARQMIDAGGNAFDAAVAAGFVSMIAEPVLTGAGGGGFLMGASSQGDEVLYDFFTNVPGLGLRGKAKAGKMTEVPVKFSNTTQTFYIGKPSIAVPGLLKGLTTVHEKLGRMPIQDVIQPAVELGKMGVPLNKVQAYALVLLEPIVKFNVDSRKIFAPHGHLLKEGEKIANPELSSFFEKIPDGIVDEFYEGELAKKISDAVLEDGGMLTLEDLKNYQVIERDPLIVPYKNRRILTNPLPSLGGTILAYMLEALETEDLEKSDWGSEKHFLTVCAAIREGESLRDEAVENEGVLAKKEIEEVRKKIRHFSRGTTHISVDDGQGNFASLSSSNGEGSGFIVPGTGVMLNNMLGEDDVAPQGLDGFTPGERMGSTMCPTMVLYNHQVELILGSGGSKRIRTALLQTILNHIDFKMSLNDSIDSARLHWDGKHTQTEPGYPQKTIEACREKCKIHESPDKNLYFGGVHAVHTEVTAHGDPRRGGNASVFELEPGWSE